MNGTLAKRKKRTHEMMEKDGQVAGIDKLGDRKVEEQKEVVHDRSESPALDMFASSSSEESSMQKEAQTQKPMDQTNNAARKANQHDIDDSEGYYLTRNGEKIGHQGEYTVLGSLGRGVFSTVVLCTVDPEACDNNSKTQLDAGKGKKVAIKMIRNNASMKRAGQQEIALLEKIRSLPAKNTYLIQLLDHFEHRKHLCMVFEPMKLNLREVLHQYGKNVGLNLRGVRIYAKQLFTALSFLSKLNVVHADFKLDNILVSEKLGLLKLCDFGSAFYQDDPSLEPTPYLVSRYYRAPEIILGLKYTKKVDVWALACCLFELFTGKILFRGDTNNEMLALMQRTKGRFTSKMLRKHLTSYLILHKVPHFDPSTYKFRELSWDSLTNELVTKTVVVLDKPVETVSTKVLKKDTAKGEDGREIKLFANLVDQCLALDPQKRTSPEEALKHRLFTDLK